MDDVWAFIKGALSNMPEKIGYDTEDHSSIVQPTELPEPNRCKFELEMVGSTAMGWQKLAAFCSNFNDVANLRDLDSFDVDFQSPVTDFPSYIS